MATFVEAGRNMKGGLPFTPWAAELRKQRMARFSQDNPDAQCLPMGFLQTHTHSQPRRIVHTKDDVIIMYEANQGLRQIFTDGRTLPRGSEPAVGGLLSRPVGRRHAGRRVARASGTTAGST